MFETTHGFFFFLFFSLILLFLCSPRLPMIERPVEKIKEVIEKGIPSKKKKVILLRSKQKEDQPYELQPDPRVYQNQPELKQPRFIEEPPLQPHPPMPPVQLQPQQPQQQYQPPPVQELPGLPEHPYPMTPEEQPNEPVPFGDDVGCPL